MMKNVIFSFETALLIVLMLAFGVAHAESPVQPPAPAAANASGGDNDDIVMMEHFELSQLPAPRRDKYLNALPDLLQQLKGPAPINASIGNYTYASLHDIYLNEESWDALGDKITDICQSKPGAPNYNSANLAVCRQLVGARDAAFRAGARQTAEDRAAEAAEAAKKKIDGGVTPTGPGNNPVLSPR